MEFTQQSHENDENSQRSVAQKLGRVSFGCPGDTHFFNSDIDREFGTSPIGSTAKLFISMGYKLDAFEMIEAFPTPDTLVKCASDFGVMVKIFEGVGYIKPKQYVQTFAEGKYPVAVGTYDRYRHDIDDDHLSAMILGGNMLRDELQRYAASALVTGYAQDLEVATDVIDQFTSKFRDIVADSYLGQLYGNVRHSTMRELAKLIKKMDISEERFEELLGGAKKRATELDMDIL